MYIKMAEPKINLCNFSLIIFFLIQFYFNTKVCIQFSLEGMNYFLLYTPLKI